MGIENCIRITIIMSRMGLWLLPRLGLWLGLRIGFGLEKRFVSGLGWGFKF